MMVESFNLALFKRLTTSCALILQELHDEHEQKIAKVHLIGLLADEEEDQELLAEVEDELLAQEEDKELLVHEEGIENSPGSCVVNNVDDEEVHSFKEETFVSVQKQSNLMKNQLSMLGTTGYSGNRFRSHSSLIFCHLVYSHNVHHPTWHSVQHNQYLK